MGIAMIMLQVRSPMLVAVGMYLELGTTSAIFVGGVIRWFCGHSGPEEVTRKWNVSAAFLPR